VIYRIIVASSKTT